MPTSSKPIEAPAVVHGNSDAARTKWFKESADDWKRKSCSVNGGKGSKPRTNLASKDWQDNYDAIFRKTS